MIIHLLARIPKIIRAIKVANTPYEELLSDKSDQYFDDRSEDEIINEYKKIQWIKLVLQKYPKKTPKI